MGSTRQPFDWSIEPASWSEIGQRTLYEIYDVISDKYTGPGAVEATGEDITRAIDRAIRSVTPLATVQAWVADKCSDIPEVAA